MESYIWCSEARIASWYSIRERERERMKQKEEDGDGGSGGGGGGGGGEWAELTRECLINILSRMSLEQLWRGPMFACKSWMSASTDPSLHTTLDLDPLFESSSDPPLLRWSPHFERKIDSVIHNVVVWSQASLSLLRTRHCSHLSLSFAAQRCPNLEVLSIKSSPRVTDASIAEISFKCVKLRELDLSYCYGISYESLVLIGKNCPNLMVLKRNFMNWLDPSEHAGIVPSDYLDACPQDGDSEATAIGKFMPNLVHLEIRFSKLTVRGLGVVCRGCKDLEYLDLYGCANLRSRDIDSATQELKRLKGVKKLNFCIPRTVGNTERYGHWRLYDERFQNDVFRV